MVGYFQGFKICYLEVKMIRGIIFLWCTYSNYLVISIIFCVPNTPPNPRKFGPTKNYQPYGKLLTN